MLLPRYDALTVATPGAPLLGADDVRAHGRITQHDEDPLIDSYIATATDEAQDMLGMVFMASTWTLALPCFPSCRDLIVPRWPLRSVSSISYVAADGVPATFATSNLHVIDRRRPPVLRLIDGAAWPVGQSGFPDVRLTLAMGFATPAAVPEMFRQVVRWLVLRMFEERLGPAEKSNLDNAINNFYRQHRVREAV